ncbi:BON domain-containing protein [soil metagenome]
MTKTVTKTDLQLKTDIEAELAWDPSVNPSGIKVTVDRGAVSLDGIVNTFPAKWAAEDAVMRVAGARTIAQHLAVEVLPEHRRSDAEIRSAADHQLRWDVFVPRHITATVHEGVVTLQGQVTWNFQRAAAARVIQSLAGVSEVANEIVLRPAVNKGHLKEVIERALHRQAKSAAASIHVTTTGETITLTGRVASWASAKDAEHVAWSVPGVTAVIDHLTIEP